MQGLHLTADLRGCRCERRWLLDAPALAQFCVDVASRAGLSPLGRLFHPLGGLLDAPGGVRATVLLAESPICVHPFPEHDAAVTLDVDVCNFSADHSARCRTLFQSLLALFEPAETVRHENRRGSIGG